MLTYFICQKMLLFDDCCIRTFVLDVASAWLDTLLDVIDLLPKEVIKKEVSSSPSPRRGPLRPHQPLSLYYTTSNVKTGKAAGLAQSIQCQTK